MDRITIITRTSDRRKHFERCLKSIQNQTYNNIEHIVICDNASSVQYVREHMIEPFFINNKRTDLNNPPPGCRILPHNLYFNEIDKELMDGWILYLDDDDILIDNNAIENLMNRIKDKDVFYTFKVKLVDRYIPNKEPLYNKPVLNDFSGSGLLYHTKYWQNDLGDGYSGGDFRCGMKLYNNIPRNKFLNLTVVYADRANRGKRIE